VVDIGIGEDDAGDRRVTRRSSGGLLTRMKFGRGFDLCAQVGRGSEQKPHVAVGADGDLRLGAGFAGENSGAQGAAVGADAIPLRESAAGGRAEDFDAHECECTSRWLRFPGASDG
jgi:hypothetical protein